MIGALFALFLGLFFTIDERLFRAAGLFGSSSASIFGATFAAIGAGDVRRAPSVRLGPEGCRRTQYEIQVDDEVADRAREILATL